MDRERIDRVLKDWEASGVSGREFARRIGVGQTTLYRWKRRYGAAAEFEFAPVVVKERHLRPASAGFVIEVAGGLKIGVPLGFDGGELRRLIGVLEDGAGC